MYEKYADDELIEAYNSMMDYSGKISPDLAKVIQSRGGLENFQKGMERKKLIAEETIRVKNEINAFHSAEADPEFIRKLISSDILTQPELDVLVKAHFDSYDSFVRNRSVDSKLLINAVLAAILSCLAGAVVWALFLFLMTSGLTVPIVIGFIIMIYGVNYLLIKLITKRTRANIVVFILTFVATCGSILLGSYLAGFFMRGVWDFPY